MTTRTAPHQANIDRKTVDALDALELLITDQFIPAAGIYTDVTDLDTGFAFFLDQLIASDDDAQPWWTMLGLAADLYTSRSNTRFDTSRQSIIDALRAIVERPIAHGADYGDDPFDGLAF